MSEAKRLFLLAAGWISLALGVIGVFLPIMPTTPFVLLAAWCFLRSSERAHRWLVGHPVFGPIVAAYLEGRGIPRRAKIVAITTLWLGILGSAYFFVPHWAGDLVMVLIACAVTVHLLRMPTAPDGAAKT